jgi:hypothetical protein
MPARPASVSGSPPIFMASRAISARPRVISAARVLWPKPSPSLAPAGDGDDVLQRAAHLDAHHVVGHVHAEAVVGPEGLLHHAGDLEVVRGGHHHRGQPPRHLARERSAPTAPRTAARTTAAPSAITSLTNCSEPCSMPFVALTTGTARGTASPAPAAPLAARAWEWPPPPSRRLEGTLQVGRRRAASPRSAPRQKRRVFPRLLDGSRRAPAAAPRACTLWPLSLEHLGQGAAPAARSQHRDAHRSPPL